ncbi:PIN domain-containing protein [Streptomyces hokutonensis]|uniref:PIN domain-containing protein n=1 Tax=Streptomyces hokutonensis TaxID=1306990 RepID=UPI00131A3CF5|nr:PIN domain-containing protein [Streptomyces hokutonensis]
MRVKPGSDVPGVIRLLREFAQRFKDGYGQPTRAQWYAGQVDSLETLCRHSFEDTGLAEGLLTDRYWHILQNSVPDDVYGAGVFKQELNFQAWRLERAAQQLESVRDFAQSGEGIVVVPDSNILIHCGEVQGIDWKAAVGAEKTHIIVPLVVVAELDELKRTLRDKKDRETIRTNIRQLRAVLHGVKPGDAARLADGVTIAVLPDPVGHRRLPVNDEEICERAALLKSFRAPLVLATNDYNMQIRALGFDLDTVEVPEAVD